MRAHARLRWWIVPILSVMALGAAADEAPLVEAVKKADRQAVRTFIERHGNVNTTDADGTTALHWAAHRDDAETVDLLVNAGADVNARNRYGATPLLLACVNGSATVVDRLLSAGAEPNTAMPNEGDTALMTAARTGNLRVVRSLIASGANVNATERLQGQTALMWAAAENNASAVQALVDAGADVRARTTSERGFTPLLFAARAGSVDAARALLAAGADPNETLATGMSALVLAVANAQYDLAAFLLDHGADPNAAAQGWTALHQVTWTRKPNTSLIFSSPVTRGGVDSLSFVKKLLAHGADPNARLSIEPENAYAGHNGLNRIGATPFFLASFRLDLPLMRLLLENRADPLLSNADNTTPLMVAAGVGFFVEGENPFTVQEAIEGVKLCLDAGGDATAVDLNGDTALHGAAFRGVNAAVSLLVAAGARLDVKNHPIVRKPGSAVNRLEQGLAQKAAADGGWIPWRIAAGVTDIFGLRQKPETAALLRKLMEERGLWTSDLEAVERRAK